MEDNSIFVLCGRGYVGIHSSGFRDFLLKPELRRAIVDSGFEHPSEGKFISVFLIILTFPMFLYNFIVGRYGVNIQK